MGVPHCGLTQKIFMKKKRKEGREEGREGGKDSRKEERIYKKRNTGNQRNL